MSPEKVKHILFLTENRKLKEAVVSYLRSQKILIKIKLCEGYSCLEREVKAGNISMCFADYKLGHNLIVKAIDAQKSIDSDLPFIIITEKDKQDAAAELLAVGADDYITLDNMKRLAPVIRRETKAYEEVQAGKKARQEIKELMNIVQSAEDEVYVLGGESHKIKFANKKALSNLGYDMQELDGKNIHDITEEGLPLKAEEREAQGRVMLHTRFIRKDGTKYPAEAIFQTAETEGGTAILVIVHDSTEKESAKQHAFVLNKAIDASASAVTVTDSDFCIIYLNKKQITTAGNSKAFMIGKDITEQKMYESSGKEFFNALDRCRRGESWVGEYQKTGHNGEEYIVLGSMSPVYSDLNTVTNIVIVEEDITERVRIKSQLLHAQKMETVGELTSGIAHDFTNMLTAIGGFSSIMKRKMDKDSRFYVYAEKISELTVRARELTKNLLTFSRKQMEAERAVSVNTLVKSVGEFLTMVIGSRIELELKLMEEDINIMGDPVQLEQVIINLATNARDAIEAEGKLVITTDKTMVSDEKSAGGFAEYAVISVKDNGCGIDQKTLDKIFEPFYTTKQAGKGTGLGLYIVTDIITRHHGYIECFSEPGQGTEFVIKLPVTDQTPEAACAEAEIEDSSENITILLVEDEKIVRESLSHALDVYGYKVYEAVNGKEAVEIFKQRSFEIDMVISDIVMPVMNGITAYKEMIAIKPGQKFIFTTGYVGEAHRKEGFDEEDHVVMIKPLMLKELVRKIEELLREN
ncbi:PAS/PAC sensor hybrid histidine kinase [Denitrovibrio acetiphilus DSM 12809]|uniref:histidine kinase n=1 Tax=Denitrovibrio acetiphilus (strain DSM 12809 / NBRC 114555 / N2460) TaxID=522772 RepID=D4H6F7_DENA2|nr:PAS domain-containing protein [Denitrovibrio acetiphilus]ADD69631.1 PAS/PAC sensor hybrid histidine kinase [Denitrovibrio acetiphilus DSM 12809]